MFRASTRIFQPSLASAATHRIASLVFREARHPKLSDEGLHRYFSTSARSPETTLAAFDTPAASDGYDSVVEIFRCDGIEPAAVQMRRRVQLGIALEVAGTQVSNFMYHSNWEDYVHAMNTFYFENSALLLGVHVLLVWGYHTFLRDALLARHVTRIATATPQAVSAGSAGAADADTICVVIVETGPWARRIELKRLQIGTRNDEVDELGSQVPFGELLQLGVLHADRKRGEILDACGFEQLLRGGLAVGREEVTTDIATAQYAFVSPDKMMPFLVDAGISESSEDSTVQRLKKNAWVHKVAQLPGGRIMDLYGNLALAMGIGTVLVWMTPSDYLKTAWNQQK